MDTSLLIYLVLAVIFIILVFTVIKKVVKAIIAVIIIFILIIVAAAGMVYLDYNNLAGQDNYDLGFALVEGETSILGISFKVENGTLETNSIRGLEDDKLTKEYFKDLSSDDSKFMFTIEKDWYFNLIESKSEYVLPLDEERTLSSSEIKEILETNEDPRVVLLDAIFRDSDLSPEERAEEELSALREINDLLDEYDSSVSELVFAASLLELLDNRLNVVEFADGIKQEDVELYPERFSFKLLKFILPSDVISSLFPEEQNSSSE